MEKKPAVLHNFEGKAASNSSRKVFIVLLVFLLLGGLTGYGVASFTSNGSSLSSDSGESSQNNTNIKKGTVVGVQDEKTFTDNAEGVLRDGGIEGEGTHHLERPGGESQNVYLTSSVLNLSDFAGRKIKVWGKTYAGEKAGWLMDVGRVQVLD